MGEYTTFKKFYKPARTEFVNVDQHWNFNLDIMDEQAFPVFNTQYTDVPDITLATGLPKQPGYHWYKSFSNSSFYMNEAAVVQDPSARVVDWQIFDGFLPGWRSPTRPGRDMRLRYRLLPGGNNPPDSVQWVGEVEKSDGSIIAFHNAEQFGVMPVAARTTNYTREACVLGGIEGGNLSPGMFTTFADGRMILGMMGNPSPGPGARYVSMVGVQYAIS